MGLQDIWSQTIGDVLRRREKPVVDARTDDSSGLVDVQVPAPFVRGGKLYQGVDKSIRKQLWLGLIVGHRGKGFAALLQAQADEEVVSIIKRDISRTFPGHPFFSSDKGQQALLDVLVAYSVFDPVVQYCQGMNFLAGMMLMYLEPSDAFDVLHYLLFATEMRTFYLPTMEGVLLRMWQMERLMERKLPKLSKHLEEHGVGPFLYASSWFLTVFSTEFPIRFALRVLDVVLAERSTRIIMQVALMLMEECEAHVLGMDDFEEIVNHIRTWLPQLPLATLHEILTAALSSTVTQDDLDELEREYHAENNSSSAAAQGDGAATPKANAARHSASDATEQPRTNTQADVQRAPSPPQAAVGTEKETPGSFSLIDMSDALPAVGSLYPSVPGDTSGTLLPQTHAFTPTPTSLESAPQSAPSAYPPVPSAVVLGTSQATTDVLIGLSSQRRSTAPQSAPQAQQQPPQQRYYQQAFQQQQFPYQAPMYGQPSPQQQYATPTTNRHIPAHLYKHLQPAQQPYAYQQQQQQQQQQQYYQHRQQSMGDTSAASATSYGYSHNSAYSYSAQSIAPAHLQSHLNPQGHRVTSAGMCSSAAVGYAVGGYHYHMPAATAGAGASTTIESPAPQHRQQRPQASSSTPTIRTTPLESTPRSPASQRGILGDDWIQQLTARSAASASSPTAGPSSHQPNNAATAGKKADDDIFGLFS